MDNGECLQADGPVMCANGCGFFGSRASMNMCSKCFKEHVLKSGDLVMVVLDTKEEVKEEVKEEIKEEVKEEVKEIKKVAHRCHMCRKKLSIATATAGKCRCGDYFCSAHVFSSDHKCTYDFKALWREKISKSNPVIQGEKFNKI